MMVRRYIGFSPCHLPWRRAALARVASGYGRESPVNGLKHHYSADPGVSGGFRSYYGHSTGEMLQSPSDFRDESLNDSTSGGNVSPYWNGGGGGAAAAASVVQQRPNGLYGQGSSDVSGSYGQSTVYSHQSSGQFSTRNVMNTEISQQSPYNTTVESTGNFQRSPSNYYYRGTTENYQRSPGGYRGHNAPSPNEYQGGINGMNMQNNAPSPNEYQRGTNGVNMQNVGYLAGDVTHQISNGNNYGMGPYQAVDNLSTRGESVEATEGSQSRPTPEELDELCKEGKLKEAIEVLSSLEQQHIPVDIARYYMLMKACGEAKAIEEAKYVHDHFMRSVTPVEFGSYNKILEMYCICGSMDDAYAVFNKMPQRNLTTWDTMIIWLARNGLGEEAIELFTRFKESGLQPDGQMFLRIFSACSFLGDVTEGLLHFESMSKTYGIIPTMVHYVSVVEMLGSTGYLDEAFEFIEKIPVEPSIDIWETLMNFCRVHGNMELGDRCAELVELQDPSRLHEQSKAGLIPVKASDIAKEKEKKKLASQNLLEVRSRVHEYRAGDTSHPDNDKIYALLRGMRQQMKEAGYIPETKFVLHDIDQEGKEDALLAHSERLAVAQGLMTSPARSSIRIIKNLRVCGDCHNALKIISKLVGRELIIRDAKRFHHFKDGLCSCRDYW